MRLADAAVAVSRLFHEITQSIASREPYVSVPPSEALELITIMTFVVVTTQEDRPCNREQIAKQLNIPRTTVLRRLETLIASGRIRRIESPHENLYVASLEFYDETVTLANVEEWFEITLRAAQELTNVRSGFGK